MSSTTGRNVMQGVVFFAVLAVVWEVSVHAFGIRSYLLPPLSAVAKSWSARAGSCGPTA